MAASASPSPPQQQPQRSHRLRPPSARLAGINTITITWSPGGQLPATSRLLRWPPARAAGGGGVQGAAQGHGERAGAAVLSGAAAPSARLLTCGPQAELHAAPLELAAALALGHNEVAVMQAGKEGGEAAVLAAARQGRRDPERPRAPGTGPGGARAGPARRPHAASGAECPALAPGRGLGPQGCGCPHQVPVAVKVSC